MGSPNFGVKLMLNVNIFYIYLLIFAIISLILVVTLLPYKFLMSVLATAMVM